MNHWDPETMIRYEDRSILVVWKPAGMAVETRRVSETDLESALKSRRVQNKEKPDIFIIQRLDQPVEGLLVFAKTKQAAENLTKQLQSGTIRKIYRAKVEGRPADQETELRDYLVKDAKTNKTIVVEPPEKERNTSQGKKSRKTINRKGDILKEDAPRGSGNGEGGTKGISPKLAVLQYRKIADDEVEVKLETGRHHQIRAQLAHAGMPIRGDRKYGAKTGGQLCLSACRLAFRHPDTGKMMEFSSVPTFDKLDQVVSQFSTLM